MKTSWFLQFMFKIKILKNQWIYCCLKMMIILIMCPSKILTDLCFTKQKIKAKKKTNCRNFLQCFSRESVR